MVAEYQLFDAARGNLESGITLVEASAGTGKTFAITMLVLRAVAELSVPIEKILIVTFTKAATEELRLRIRARLVEARSLLAERAMGVPTADASLVLWVDALNNRDQALKNVQMALADIDRVGVFTIHGFCQRMLVEQALESGQLFDVELLTDVLHVRLQVAEDFWRSRIYALAPLPCALVMRQFSTPQHLLAGVSATQQANCRIEPQAQSLAEVLARLSATAEGLRGWWRENDRELRKFFENSLALGLFKKDFSEEFDSWFTSLADFFGGTTETLPEKIGLLDPRSLASQLNGNKIRGEEKRLSYFADWPLPQSEVTALLAAAEALLLCLRVELAERLRSEVLTRLLQRGNLGFDDLISRLSLALREEQGAALQSLVAARYAVVLIDEFQDTDGLQWHIFSTIFGGGLHRLYLIGDPKQAIYKFRGADIHSYFIARQGAERLLTLEKNYRSHPSLVGEVNRLFTCRPRPFYYPPDILDYRPVTAAKKAEDIDLLRQGKSLAGMVYCTLAENNEDASGRWSSTKAAERFQSFVVAEIERLLDPLSPVLLRMDGERPLAPHDLAVLVRSNRQAEAYRLALTRAGIPAVVAGRTSVFHAVECRDLLLLLQALAFPGDTVKVRTALTIPWFGLTGNDLAALFADEERFNQLQGRFYEYHQRWHQQGVLAMMSHFLAAEDVLIKIAGTPLAERAIANIFHLLELIEEQESLENLGMSRILQWLLQMSKDDATGDNTELLLESDEEAVRIVTMHGAKGLEYPVVFCPYLWYRSERLSGEKYQVSAYDEDHQLVVDLGSERFIERRAQAMEEQMAEELRLFYVAVTRAKIRCYLMWADVKGRAPVVDSFQSALGYLLFPGGVQAYQEQQTYLQGLRQHHKVQVLTVTDEKCHAGTRIWDSPEELRPLAAAGRSLYTDWQMSSFSAMAMLSEYEQEGAAIFHSTGRPIPVPGLPAGAGFGNLIHDLLEECSFASIAQGVCSESLLRRKCHRHGQNIDPAEIIRLLQQVVSTPLLLAESFLNFSLAEVDAGRCLKEMAFYYAPTPFSTDRINAALADEPTFIPLSHRAMRGYLTGFVDLLCEYGGRYYLVDYKTNFLGESVSDYRAERLVAAMQSHNYGLQYWLYTLVLHDHLRNCRPGYQYEEHFGGVLYLFVRGMTVDIPGSGVFFTRPSHERLEALHRAMGAQ